MRVGIYVRIIMASNTITDAKPLPNTGNASGVYKPIRRTMFWHQKWGVNDNFDFYSNIDQQQKMKQVWLGICLCALLIAVATQQGNKREHRSKWGNNKKRDQISILKCQDVVCQDGKFCYNGICKKVDYRCIGKKCEKGFRCNKGECVEQRHKPKKQLCEPLGFDKQRLRCGERQKDRCLGSEVRPRVCGFTWGGVFQEFENQCSACLTHRFKYYFESSCSEAPKICSDQEQCLNGLCSLILDEQVYENQRSCNENEECKANQQCAGHKCIKKVELLAYLKTAFEAAPILQNA